MLQTVGKRRKVPLNNVVIDQHFTFPYEKCKLDFPGWLQNEAISKSGVTQIAEVFEVNKNFSQLKDNIKKSR